MDFDRFTVTLLVLRDDAPELTEQEADDLQDQHLAYLASLHEAGYLVAAGPASSPGTAYRGVSILNVDPERARELKEADPAVRAGKFSVIVLPWMVPAGAVTFQPTRFPHSIAEARD